MKATHPDGSFRFDNIPVGNYILTFTRSGFPPISSGSLEVARNRTTVVPSVILTNSAEGVTAMAGRVVLSGEEEYGGVLIHVSTDGYAIDAVTAPDGSFAVTGIPAGHYKVRFVKSGFGTVQREATVEQGQYLLLPEVRMPKGGTVEPERKSKGARGP